MGFLKFNFRSAALSMDAEVAINFPTDRFNYYPPEAPRHHIVPGAKPKPQIKPGMKFQTVYIPMSASTDPTHIFTYTNIAQYADDNMVMLVVVNMTNSFGVDTCYGVEYSTFLTEELPVYIQTLFASSPKREDNFIAGMAAGGNASLYNAVRHPEKYAACVDMSGGIGMSFDIEKVKRIHESGPFAQFRSSFPPADEIEGSEFDLRALTEKHKAAGIELPELIFVRGSEEGRIGEFVDKDAEIAAELGYKTQYHQDPGGHNDLFWNLQWKKIFDEYLPLKREPV